MVSLSQNAANLVGFASVTVVEIIVPGPQGAKGDPGQSVDTYSQIEIDQIIAGLQAQIAALAAEVASLSAGPPLDNASFFSKQFSPLLLS